MIVFRFREDFPKEVGKVRKVFTQELCIENDVFSGDLRREIGSDQFRLPRNPESTTFLRVLHDLATTHEPWSPRAITYLVCEFFE